MTELDKKILNIIKNTSTTLDSPADFCENRSAINKADSVVTECKKRKVDLPKSAYISLGGADGTELKRVLNSSPIKHGVLVEFEDDLSQKARNAFSTLNSKTEVCTGDVFQKLPKILKILTKWRELGEINNLIISIHALIHELPLRGDKNDDIEKLLASFIELNLPLQCFVREPCFPSNLPEILFLQANCESQNLAMFSQKIKDAHQSFFDDSDILRVHEKVRMSSRLAIETILKMFYIDSFAYEIGELGSFFNREDLLQKMTNVFGVTNVKHSDLQTDSFEKLWVSNKIQLTDSENRILTKPQLHIFLIGKWTPKNTPDSSYTPNTEQEFPIPEISTPFSGEPQFLPDLFTPGANRERIKNSLHRVLGEEMTSRLMDLSNESILSVEDGDFEKQVNIGEELVEISNGIPELYATGLYFAGEGYRLIADIEKDEKLREEFRDLAKDYYKEATGISPITPNSYRGLGRLSEIEGDFENAMRYFDIANGFATASYATGHALGKSTGLAHEILRISRHRIHCIWGMKKDSNKNSWNSEVKKAELIGELAKSDIYHQDLLRLFREFPKWQHIEFFMATVFLAKAWGDSGEPYKSESYFIEALKVRFEILTNHENLSIIERENLKWWCNSVLETEGINCLICDKSVELLDALKKDAPSLNIVNLTLKILEPRNALKNMLSNE